VELLDSLIRALKLFRLLFAQNIDRCYRCICIRFCSLNGILYFCFMGNECFWLL